jgi:glycosyltransferase involved in cell wall biosynthesis
MAEAQSCGTPVIAHAAGGALEIVTDESGMLIRDDTPQAFADALGGFVDRDDAERLQTLARRFAVERFDDAILELVDLALARDWEGVRAQPRWVDGQEG